MRYWQLNRCVFSCFLKKHLESCQAIAVQQADCSKLQGRVQQSYDCRKLSWYAAQRVGFTNVVFGADEM